MARARTITSILLATLPFLAPCLGKSTSLQVYKNFDGYRVAISQVGKTSGHRDNESELEFYSSGSQRLCTLDYSSEDGQHGYGVVKAAWTPDGQYFVFSLTSSGGHQSWHAPTLFYSSKDRAVFSLDDYVQASGISKADFTLKAPNTVLTEAWTGKAVPVSFKLGGLSTVSTSSHRPFSCVDGNVIYPKN